MVTLRCTQKLLRRLEVTDKPAAPTTVLGDWYANILFSRPHQLVLCVSERSLLPVVLLAKETQTLASRLAGEAGQVLQRLGVAPSQIERELSEMRSFAYSRTQNRQVLGSLNDLMFQLSWYMHHSPGKSLREQSLHLAVTPCSPIGYSSPDKLTVELFQSTRIDAEAFH